MKKLLTLIRSLPAHAYECSRKSDGALFTKPYLIREIADVKIGLIGFAYPNTPQQLYVRARQAAHRGWQACHLRAT
jgi:hypothetical protein